MIEISVKGNTNFYLDDRNNSTPRILQAGVYISLKTTPPLSESYFFPKKLKYIYSLVQAIRKLSDESYEVKKYKIIGELYDEPFPSSILGKYSIDLANDFQILTVHPTALNKVGFIFTVDGVTVFHTLMHQHLRD